MLVFETLVLAAANDGGTRGFLLLLVIVAMILLIAGVAIALTTFFNLRKTQTTQADFTPEA